MTRTGTGNKESRYGVTGYSIISRYLANKQNTEAVMKIKGGVIYSSRSQHRVALLLESHDCGRHLLVATSTALLNSRESQCHQQIIQVLTPIFFLYLHSTLYRTIHKYSKPMCTILLVYCTFVCALDYLLTFLLLGIT